MSFLSDLGEAPINHNAYPGKEQSVHNDRRMTMAILLFMLDIRVTLNYGNIICKVILPGRNGWVEPLGR
jgi:hypothetical protein